jgi:hypothetical protein
MNFTDSVTMAMQHAFDLDTPQYQLPIFISQNAYQRSALESDRMGCAGLFE